MKFINKYYFLLLIFTSNMVYAKSVEASILNLVRIFTKITIATGSIGLLIAASGFIMGKNDAGANLQRVIMGIAIAVTSGVINQTILKIA